MAMLAFLTIPTTIWLSAHAYLAWRYGKTFPTKKKPIYIAAGLLFPLLPITFIAGRNAPPSLGDPLAWISFSYMGVFVMLFCLTVFRDVIGIAVALFQQIRGKDFDPARRAFFGRGASAGLFAATGAMSAVGAYFALRTPTVERVDVRIKNLPKEFEGYRIVQMSDIHIGPTIKKEFMTEIVSIANSLAPDMVALTGDLVDGHVDTLREHIDGLKNLKTKDGVFFCTGNHEYYWNVFEWIDHFRSLGINVLLNEHKMVQRGGASMRVAGCTDYSSHRRENSHQSNPVSACQGEKCDLTILLAHQPKSIFEAVKAGADLQLSGHTHGGQFFPGNVFVGLAHPYTEGLNKEKDTWIYVNRGTGYWGPPFRHNGGGEITLLTLVRG